MWVGDCACLKTRGGVGTCIQTHGWGETWGIGHGFRDTEGERVWAKAETSTGRCR